MFFFLESPQTKQLSEVNDHWLNEQFVLGKSTQNSSKSCIPEILDIFIWLFGHELNGNLKLIQIHTNSIACFLCCVYFSYAHWLAPIHSGISSERLNNIDNSGKLHAIARKLVNLFKFISNAGIQYFQLPKLNIHLYAILLLMHCPQGLSY